jgi:hypothetical protein
MRLPRRTKIKRHPAPRIDATNDRAEAVLFEEAFAEPLWRRPTPL